jgi:hypothetical protein
VGDQSGIAGGSGGAIPENEPEPYTTLPPRTVKTEDNPAMSFSGTAK